MPSPYRIPLPPAVVVETTVAKLNTAETSNDVTPRTVLQLDVPASKDVQLLVRWIGYGPHQLMLVRGAYTMTLTRESSSPIAYVADGFMHAGDSIIEIQFASTQLGEPAYLDALEVVQQSIPQLPLIGIGTQPIAAVKKPVTRWERLREGIVMEIPED